MFEENELIMLILGLCALAVILANLQTFRRIPDFRLLFIAFGFTLLGWFATVLEALMWRETFNYFEHAAYAMSSLVAAAWVWRAFGERRRESA